ncbi:hypothetical protein EJ06DRAFT_473573 [Trichodelitschia bisporula]|uniref:Zn(2)-C6 fungal-type domain-containing protein n=1 Tax=Trichodelitschia bisporula TaxID=703511 RepID=A0A6G1I1T6_9PEZI|nr:hypothetical protein EJ06DRAFT_473573 [Trichodelitschia bisporula]
MSPPSAGTGVHGSLDNDLRASSVNPRKRPSTDTIDYPRRRATIACEICRSRKSRCDGSRPKCRLCTELNAECVYREPGIKLDAGDKLIIQHLEKIESLLQHQLASAASTPAPPLHNGLPPVHSPAATSSSTIGDDAIMRHGARSTPTPIMHSTPPLGVNIPASSPNGVAGTWATGPATTTTPTAPTPLSMMPRNHTTPALNLLQWPKIRDLVSHRWDPQVLVQLEMQREPLPYTTRPPDFTHAAQYADAFFKRVNVWYACVSPHSWHRYYRNAQAVHFREGAESCIALLVLALGCAQTGGSISQLPPKAEAPGFPFFIAAWGIMPSLMMRTDVLAAQCQILAAAYLFYTVRPLEAWNLLASTSMKLQLLLSSTVASSASKKLAERVYWNALLFESDLLAELELPHSGIIQFENLVSLPEHFEKTTPTIPPGHPPPPPEPEPPGIDDLRYFVAEIELRRLLNRVSNMIYSKSSPITSTAALDPVVGELDASLTEWYQNLPTGVQFVLGHTPLSSPVQTVLRLRYFACRTIIYRPYVLAVLIKEAAFLDPAVSENCRRCLEACIRQLECITAHHAGHLPYLWQGALSIVSQALLVMGASMSPSLATLLPRPQELNSIIDGVVVEVQRYAHLAPSLKLAAELVRQAEERRRMNMRSPSMAYVKVVG